MLLLVIIRGRAAIVSIFIIAPKQSVVCIKKTTKFGHTFSYKLDGGAIEAIYSLGFGKFGSHPIVFCLHAILNQLRFLAGPGAQRGWHFYSESEVMSSNLLLITYQCSSTVGLYAWGICNMMSTSVSGKSADKTLVSSFPLHHPLPPFPPQNVWTPPTAVHEL